jgi:hypothetical protein
LPNSSGRSPYDADERTLVINPAEAETVRRIFALYRELGCVRRVKEEADCFGLRTKRSITANGAERGGKPFSRGHLYTLLSNPIYTAPLPVELICLKRHWTAGRSRPTNLKPGRGWPGDPMPEMVKLLPESTELAALIGPEGGMNWRQRPHRARPCAPQGHQR